MKKIWILISPEIKSAYFSEYLQVAQAEFSFAFPNAEYELKTVGSLNFIICSLNPDFFAELARLSCFQGAFEQLDNGELHPLELRDDFQLDERFVFGSKFKGKTNERLTQLLINVSLAAIGDVESPKILDPMCGRATTLLWAMRYGIHAKGIEQDPKALEEITTLCKKWQTITNTNLGIQTGFVGKKNKLNHGKFIEISFPSSTFKVVQGDTVNSDQLLAGERFDIILTDLPYGIHHTARQRTRNPLETIKLALPKWVGLLKERGVITLSFNRNQPKREQLLNVFEEHGLLPMNLDVSHRMSESIVRDVVIFKRSSK